MSDCFQCSHRNWRSKLDPDLIGCSEKCGAVNYKDIVQSKCIFFKQASSRELQAKLYFDNSPRDEILYDK